MCVKIKNTVILFIYQRAYFRNTENEWGSMLEPTVFWTIGCSTTRVTSAFQSSYGGLWECQLYSSPTGTFIRCLL